MTKEQEIAIVSFTPAALEKLVEVMAEQDATDAYLRISASATPQGGVEYAFGLEDEPAEDDTSLSDGSVKALVDEGSIPLLAGSSIDYVEGFQRSGFVISNPNFAGGCACGGGGCGCGR
ncbi:MAG: iron-sulfur cluster assembly accessory protein [Chloroflexi bacterium]|nr:iron-sulfur cluster assembly accessory protein [Chloroflexota bacterium]